MQRDDRLRLQHMLDAGQEAVRFTQGRTRDELDVDRKLALALVKLIEIVSEAASRVTAESQQDQPDIPWRDIVAMRNRLIHGYFDVDLDRVPTVATSSPPLGRRPARDVRGGRPSPAVRRPASCLSGAVGAQTTAARRGPPPGTPTVRRHAPPGSGG